MSMVFECPFFKRNEYLKINCEGGTIRFPDKDARREYLEGFCANSINWKKCTIAHCLENYYERKEENE